MFWTHRSFWVLPILVAAILGGLSALVSRTRLRKVYQHRFTESRRERLFLASVGFFTTVLVVRANGRQPRHPFKEKVAAHFRFLGALIRGINPRAERPPLPDFSLANVGGAIIPALGRRWRSLRAGGQVRPRRGHR